MDDVASGDDFLALDPAKLRALRIGIYDRSPASDWLARHKLLDQGVPYQIMNADPHQYPGRDHREGSGRRQDRCGHRLGSDRRLLRAAGQGRRSCSVVPLKSEPGIKFDYQMAMGVRYGEREWKQQIERPDRHRKQAEIQAILKEYGVPLVDESFGAPQN